MAWIESHQELARHPKTKRLSRALGVSIPAAIGHLHLLWWWAMDYAQDGDLSVFGDDELAEAGVWDGDATVFRAGLGESGFLDADGRIHDWQDYAGRLIERRRSDAERKRQARTGGTSKQIHRTSAGHPADVHGMSGVPDPTGPNRTGQNPTQPDPTGATARARAGGAAAAAPPAEPAAAGSELAPRNGSASSETRPGAKADSAPAPKAAEPPEDVGAVWQQAAAELRGGMNKANWDTFFAGLRPVRWANGALVLEAKNGYVADQVESRFIDLVTKRVSDAVGHQVPVVLVAAAEPIAAEGSQGRAPP